MKFNKLIPELSVSDINISLAFYKKIGFKTEYERLEDKLVFLSLEGSQIMIQEINNHWSTGKLEYPFGRGINLQIEVKDLSLILDPLKKNGIPLFKEQMENWYRKDKILLGCRECLVMDPDGYLLRFCQDIGQKKMI